VNYPAPNGASRFLAPPCPTKGVARLSLNLNWAFNALNVRRSAYALNLNPTVGIMKGKKEIFKRLYKGPSPP